MKPAGGTSAADTSLGVVIVLVLPAVDMLAPDVKMPVGPVSGACTTQSGPLTFR